MQLRNNKEFQAAKAMTIGLGSLKRERKRDLRKGVEFEFY